MVLKPNICLLLLFSLSLALALTSVSHSYKYDEPEKELHRCQLRCVRQLQPYSKQAECQDQCVKEYRERRDEGRSLDDPQGQLKRCQKQCQEQEHSQQQQCRQTCQEEYKQQQREQEERAQQEGGRRKGDDNPQVEDPQRRFEQCQDQCRKSRRGDQEQCQSQCSKEFERQQREQEERERRKGGNGREDNPHVEDPRQRLERCQEQCRRSHHEDQPQCQSRCTQEFERQQREQEERERREGGKERGEDNQVEDPRQRYEQCQEQCRSSRRGDQQQCQSQCRKKFERQQREQERERREGGRGRGEDNPQVEDPRQRYEQCQEQCRRSRRGDQQHCQSQCTKEFERQQREQERERREGGKGRVADNPQVVDPQQQYEQCQEQCRRYHPRSEEVQERCQKGCTKEYEEQRHEQEKYHDNPAAANHHVEQSYQQCRQACRRERGQPQQYCLQQCERKREEEQREHGREHGRQGNIMERGEEEQQENNPYYFQAPRFKSTFSTQEGHLRVLERFSKRSELLRGIENYRLAILEANPNTFVIPHHYDAESVFAVLQGKGVITLVQKDGRDSFNLKEGDVIRIPAGTTVYLINRDDNRKLQVAKLFQPVNTPGRFESYFGAGGENPESFYRAFSNEILQAALNTPREQLDRLFGQQSHGVITKATQEQIKALSQHVSSSSRRGKSKGPFNLLNEKPLYSNEFGQFFEASPKDYEQLRDLDLSVAFMNINQGAMIAPYYNSKSTRLVVVMEGTGRFEMACPHLSRQSHGSHGRIESEGKEGVTHYQKVRARLSAGDAFIIPAGHPISIIASRNENLRLAGFGVNAKNNQKNFLAGQEDNVWKHVESEAKELAFKLPAREVEEIFNNQRQSYFLPGPGQQQEREEERSRSMASSVLDFVHFF